MKTGHFYFIKEEFFTDFQDPLLMKNKETIDGRVGRRPCYFTFRDPNKELFCLFNTKHVPNHGNLHRK